MFMFTNRILLKNRLFFKKYILFSNGEFLKGNFWENAEFSTNFWLNKEFFVENGEFSTNFWLNKEFFEKYGIV